MTNKSNQKIDWNACLKEALDRTEFMVVATVDNDGSWICPVQFSYDEQGGLYFKSIPESRHMKNISKDHRVSVAIFSTTRLSDGEVIGIQIKGEAKILVSHEEATVAARYFYTRADKKYNYTTRVAEHLGENAVWNFVKITPTEIWYFNSQIYSEEKQGRQLVPLEEINLTV